MLPIYVYIILTVTWLFVSNSVLQRFYVNAERQLTDWGVVATAYDSYEGWLTDGWLVALEALIQSSGEMVGADGIGILGFNIETSDESQATDSSKTFRDIFGAYLTDTIEAFAHHGSQKELDLYYVLFNDANMDTGDWIYIRKLFRRVINAGDTIFDKWDASQLDGTAMTFGTLDINTQLTNVIAPERWDRHADSKSPLRFVCGMSGMGETKEIFTFVPPCTGYYTNISVQFIWKTAGPTSEQCNFSLGTDMPDFDQLGIDPASGSDEFAPDVSQNAVYYLFNPAIDDQGVDQTDKWNMVKHFGKKRIKIRESDDIMIFQLQADSALGLGDAILVQGDFVPDQYALWRREYSLGGLGAAGNWNPIYEHHIALEEVMLNFQVEVERATDEFQGFIYIRRHEAEMEVLVDTITSLKGAGDVIDDDMVDQKSRSLHGIVAKIPFDTEGLQSATETKWMPDHIVTLEEFGEGDLLSYDLRLTSGTLNGTVTLDMQVAGFVMDKFYSKAGDFVRGNTIKHADDLREARFKV